MTFKNVDLSHRKIALAFGGGGIHGAAHAGFVEALFEKFPDCIVHSMSGTSAGAITATAAAIGMHENGKQGAIQSLHRVWRHLKNTGLIDHPMNLRSLERLSGIEALPQWVEFAKTHGRMMESLVPFWGGLYNAHIRNTFNINGLLDVTTRNLVNPQGKNHLMNFIRNHFDFSSIRSNKIPKLFINAVDARTQENVIFSNNDINEHTLTASGTLPFMWSPVEYKGRHLVDGKYKSNPPILPHLNEAVDDIIVICLGHLNDEPILKEELKVAQKILQERSRLGQKVPQIHVVEVGLEGKILSKMNTNEHYIDSLIRSGKSAFNMWLYGKKDNRRDLSPKLSA